MAENEWTDELKAQVVEAYLERNPTPENSIDIVKEVADEFDKTANGVRMILVKANAYVKKTNTTASTAKSSGGSKRLNKADAIASLKEAIEKAGKEVDDDICDRLTGKAAVYITELLG